MNRQPINLMIRADAGGHKGTGHVMRQLALAQALRARGCGVTLVTAECPEALGRRIVTCGVAHVTWSNVAPGSSQDRDETVRLGRELGCEWIVLDGYEFDLSFQRQLREAGFRLLVVDDYGYGDRWCCDLLLNQNLGAERRIYDIECESGKPLLGTSFALLRSEFWPGSRATPVAGESAAQPAPLRRLLVSLGGVDQNNATGKVLEALQRIEVGDLEIRIVTGAGNPHRPALEHSAIASRHAVQVLSDVEDMSHLYEWADGIISAGGSTCWEWLLFGLPGAVVTLADNQLPIVEELLKRQLALDLGWEADFTPASAADKLQGWIEAPPSRQATEGRGLVDGRGAARVAAAITERLRINIATATSGWVLPMLDAFVANLERLGHTVQIVTRADDLPQGDIAFFLSFWSIAQPEVLTRNTHNLVVHASDLPRGKGWSPLTWQILDGENRIPVTLFEAAQRVDSGDIYDSRTIDLAGHELLDDIRSRLMEATFELCTRFVERYPFQVPSRKPQVGDSSFYPRRGPEDSRLNPDLPLADQFNLLRTVDNDSYPAFFEHAGQRYILKIEKAG